MSVKNNSIKGQSSNHKSLQRRNRKFWLKGRQLKRQQRQEVWLQLRLQQLLLPQPNQQKHRRLPAYQVIPYHRLKQVRAP